jgi:hypothetical protein
VQEPEHNIDVGGDIIHYHYGFHQAFRSARVEINSLSRLSSCQTLQRTNPAMNARDDQNDNQKGKCDINGKTLPNVPEWPGSVSNPFGVDFIILVGVSKRRGKN